MTSTGLPPILRPRWSSASSNELRMSLPITAVGPENVETKPILMVSPADAGPASRSAVAPASQNAVFMFPSLMVSPPARLLDLFVRKILLSQQARTGRAAIGPLAQWLEPMHHNSYPLGRARNIVP